MNRVRVFTAEGNFLTTDSTAEISEIVSRDWSASLEIRLRANGMVEDYTLLVTSDEVCRSDCPNVPVGSGFSVLLNYLASLGFQYFY
jgi:uncharacterized hydantoinase/oxoprolinase family protein